MLWHTLAEPGTAHCTDEKMPPRFQEHILDTAKMVRLLANGRVFCLCKELSHASKQV